MSKRFFRAFEDTDYIVYLNLLGKDPEDAARMKRMISAWARPMDKTTHELVPTHSPSIAYDAACADVSMQQKSWKHWIVCIVFRVFRGIAHDRIPTTAGTAGKADKLTVRIGGSSHARPTIRLTCASSEDSITLYVDEHPYFRLVTELSTGDVVTIRNDDGVDLTSSGVTQDASDKVDFVATDTHAMWEALTPGNHVLYTVPAAAIEMEWRNEWV